MSKIKLLLLVATLLVFCLNACQQESEDWRLLSAVSGYPELVFDGKDLLWIFDETKKSINYIVITDDEKNYVLQDIPYPSILTSQNTILKFCASQSLWIVMDSGSLLFYDAENQTWVEYSLIPGRVRSCEILDSKRVAVVIDENKIGIVEGKSFNLLPDVPGNIKNIHQDDFGDIWVISEDNLENIYIVYKQKDDWTWSEQARDLGSRLLSVKSDSIWTAGPPLVTVSNWTIQPDSYMVGSPLSQIRIDDALLDLFSDKNGNTWIVTDRSVMLKTKSDNQFNTISLPWNVNSIISSAFNIKHCILYISTEVGVFNYKNNCN